MLFSRQEIERPTEAILARVRKHPVGLQPYRTADFFSRRSLAFCPAKPENQGVQKTLPAPR